MWISEGQSDTSTGCGTYPYVPDEAQMNNHQASYMLSIRLIFVFILASSILCREVRLQSNFVTSHKLHCFEVRLQSNNLWDVTKIQFV